MINKRCSKMIKELRGSGRWCCVNLSSDYMYVWDVFLYDCMDDHHKPTIKSGSHKDLNDAIESAYKKAQVYLEKNG